jgi:hypothetical protein
MLEALEASGPAAFLRTSFYYYPLLNALHILSIGMLVSTAILMDLRVLGVGRGLPVGAVIGHLRPVAITALAVAVASGLTLFSVRPVEYFANDAFRLKMLLLAAAVGNAIAFTSLRKHHLGGKVMAALSIGLWLSVLAAGRFIGFVL